MKQKGAARRPKIDSMYDTPFMYSKDVILGQQSGQTLARNSSPTDATTSAAGKYVSFFAFSTPPSANLHNQPGPAAERLRPASERLRPAAASSSAMSDPFLRPVASVHPYAAPPGSAQAPSLHAAPSAARVVAPQMQHAPPPLYAPPPHYAPPSLYAPPARPAPPPHSAPPPCPMQPPPPSPAEAAVALARSRSLCHNGPPLSQPSFKGITVMSAQSTPAIGITSTGGPGVAQADTPQAAPKAGQPAPSGTVASPAGSGWPDRDGAARGTVGHNAAGGSDWLELSATAAFATPIDLGEFEELAMVGERRAEEADADANANADDSSVTSSGGSRENVPIRPGVGAARGGSKDELSDGEEEERRAALTKRFSAKRLQNGWKEPSWVGFDVHEDESDFEGSEATASPQKPPRSPPRRAPPTPLVTGRRLSQPNGSSPKEKSEKRPSLVSPRVDGGLLVPNMSETSRKSGDSGEGALTGSSVTTEGKSSMGGLWATGKVGRGKESAKKVIHPQKKVSNAQSTAEDAEYADTEFLAKANAPRKTFMARILGCTGS